MPNSVLCSTGECSWRCERCRLPPQKHGWNLVVGNLAWSLVILVVWQGASCVSGQVDPPDSRWPADLFRFQPQWITGPRLMRLGESLVLQFYVPAGMEAENVEIFPRYLEQAEPGPAFRPAGGLDWIESLPCESLSLSLSSAGKASITYTPLHPGHYLAALASRRRSTLPLLLGHRRRLVRTPFQHIYLLGVGADLACDRYSAGLPTAVGSISCG